MGNAHIKISKQAALEGMVLVKNEGNVLPLKSGTKVALFGKGTVDYVKGGGGSGDVTVSYKHSLLDGMLRKESKGKVHLFSKLHEFYKEEVKKQYEAGIDPGMTAEPELPEALLKEAKAFADTAIISICRFSGERWDRSVERQSDLTGVYKVDVKSVSRSAELFERGDFYLSRAEERLVKRVTEIFKKVIVVLNVGGVVDTTWFSDNEKIQAALFAWQSGNEGGTAMADILCGDETPSGKLVDTFAKQLSDYPFSDTFHESHTYVDYKEDIYVGYRYFETIPGKAQTVVYPFGYGLSYTKFELQELESFVEDDILNVRILVENIGKVEGKEVLQLYVSAPQGKLGKPAKELKAFAKTKLLNPGDGQEILLQVKIEDLASYDDLGKIQKAAYVLEKGDYSFFVGTSIRDCYEVGTVYTVEKDRVVKQFAPKCVPTRLKERMLSNGKMEELEINTRKERISSWPFTPEQMIVKDKSFEPSEVEGKITFEDVANGKATVKQLVAQLTLDEKIDMLGGQPNTGLANTCGFGNLPKYGIPNIMTADGPAGVRIEKEHGVYTTAYPCAIALASSWNTEILEKVGKAGAEECKEYNFGIWLTPAMNIHRSPLCGRNFEYFSEDPFLTGKMAAAKIRGIQSQGIVATPKHFVANNKETNRRYCDSRVSERALREIYLKGFEIAVKESNPWSIMTSYNPMNGIRTAENPELLIGILREEWGFKGLVMSDWRNEDDHAYEIPAGNDVRMPHGYSTRVVEGLKEGILEESDIDMAVTRVVEMLLKIGVK